MDTVITERWIDLDHPDQKMVVTRGRMPAYIRIDESHELPVVLGDSNCKPIARFASVGDAAAFVWARRRGTSVSAPLAVVGTAR